MNWKEQRVEIQETKEIIRPRSNKWTDGKHISTNEKPRKMTVYEKTGTTGLTIYVY